MREASNILEIAKLQPDMMGFILAPASPRYVGEDFRIPADLSPAIDRVGVFVDESSDEILRKVRTLGLNYVQLHGRETPQQCDYLRGHNIKIIKALSVSIKTDLEVAKFYLDAVDLVLFDTKGPSAGGNGIAFDWTILVDFIEEKPFILSGGINPVNASQAAALSLKNLYGLDINSGVEIAPGVKDISKVSSIQSILKQHLL